ncbi:hypothetical protein [Azospirillum agricola]|uniref:hypothetical protein n=1 Tax=Azospirillum agricola TaxID=1720247 RepID=UPI000A0F3A40|nr:hypothetical protein [Azospirillum agricola]SMH60742.1 hypothetical protein SAMN02982994_5719 [Azospirillum lipoferum]
MPDPKSLIASCFLCAGLMVAMPAQAKWTSEAEVCKTKNMPAGCLKMVTSKGFFVKWGGQMTELDMTRKGEFTGNAKVRITWISDGTSYRCGQIVQFNYFNDLKDLTALSPAMRKC